MCKINTFYVVYCYFNWKSGHGWTTPAWIKITKHDWFTTQDHSQVHVGGPIRRSGFPITLNIIANRFKELKVQASFFFSALSTSLLNTSSSAQSALSSRGLWVARLVWSTHADVWLTTALSPALHSVTRKAPHCSSQAQWWRTESELGSATLDMQSLFLYWIKKQALIHQCRKTGQNAFWKSKSLTLLTPKGKLFEESTLKGASDISYLKPRILPIHFRYIRYIK